MNGRLERVMRMAGVLILLASLQFAACLLGPAAALVAAPLMSAAGAVLWLHFELPHRRGWLVALTLAAPSLLVVLTMELTLFHNSLTWFAPLPAFGAGLGTLFFLERSRVRCTLCNRRLGRQAVVFRCPRCQMQVCDETCWSFEHRRCRLCLEQRVPVLPVEDSWWLRGTGPRARFGRCQVCMASADQLDLRACPHCTRPQCRDCWDFNNGECARCGTALPDLPPTLRTAVALVSTPSRMYTR